MDVMDFEFVPDQTGKILVSLVESGRAEDFGLQRLGWNIAVPWQ